MADNNKVVSSLQRPIGYRFKPSDQELCGFLERKVRGLELPFNETIVEMNVYSREPGLLGDHGKIGSCSERYYLVKRETKSASGIGVTPKREVSGEICGGWWKTCVGETPIKVGGRTIGYKSQLKFMQYKDQHRQRKQCIPTSWIMHEYKLPPKDKFQTWVLCRIKDKSKKPEEPKSEIQEQIQKLLNKLDNEAS